MKKLLFFALALLIPVQARAWESTISAGYDHRHFSADDQLGAVSPSEKLRPSHASGFRLGGSVTWEIFKGRRIGPEIWLGHGWMSVPFQKGYVTKTAGLIDTGDLTLQSVALVAKAQVAEGGAYRLFVKPGFLVSNLSSGLFRSVDTDTGAVAGIELSGDVGKSCRFFVDLQAIFSPSTVGPRQFVVSPNMVLGLQWVFADENHASISEPVKKLKDPDPPKIVELPRVETPTALEVKPAADKAPAPIEKSAPVSQKVKAAIKLGADGRLDPESYPTIQKVISAHNSKIPSIIKIYYKKLGEPQRLAEEISTYIVSQGCSKDDVVSELDVTLDKPIKIFVGSK